MPLKPFQGSNLSYWINSQNRFSLLQDVYKRQENRFTRFRITLPQNEQNDLSISVTSPDKTAALREVKTEDPIEPAGTEKTDKDGKKAGTVLIVEDNEEFISYLTRVIGQRYHIHTAGNGEEALKSLDVYKRQVLLIKSLGNTPN